MGFYGRWMTKWERELNLRVTSRRIRPFDWGLEYLEGVDPAGDPQAEVARYAEWAFQNSAAFYSYPHIPEFRLQEDRLEYPSAVRSPFRENNTVHGRYFPCKKSRAAVLVLPQWNADQESHLTLCRLMNRFGLSALRLTLPYHDRRRPPELQRADFIVDANIGRTLQANRQAVLDARLAVEWLVRQGHNPVGLSGTSLGACVGFLVFAHEPRLAAVVYNMGSSWFADVVWNGNTTPHVREGLQEKLCLEELRRYWAAISPFPFIEKLQGQTRPSLLISARYDDTFLPNQTRQFVEECHRCRVPLRQVHLPCGHYTMGRFPFNWLDGLIICSYLRRRLIH
jgi:hypothetical protein